MALDPGTVTANYPGASTGSGLAFALFSARLAASPLLDREHIPDGFPGSLDDWRAYIDPINAGTVNSLAALALADATTIITYLVANMEVSTTFDSTTTGLQALPVTLVAGTPTVGPTTSKTVAGKVRLDGARRVAREMGARDPGRHSFWRLQSYG